MAAAATTLKGKVGAFIEPTCYKTTLAGAITDWQNLTARKLAAHRVFIGYPPSAISSDLKSDAQAGRKVCMSLKPPVTPTSAARSAIATFLASCKSAAAGG